MDYKISFMILLNIHAPRFKLIMCIYNFYATVNNNIKTTIIYQFAVMRGNGKFPKIYVPIMFSQKTDVIRGYPRPHKRIGKLFMEYISCYKPTQAAITNNIHHNPLL